MRNRTKRNRTIDHEPKTRRHLFHFMEGGCRGCMHVMCLYMHSFCARRRAAVSHNIKSVRVRSACTHEKEDLTTSRFVRVIYSSHIVCNWVGIVSPLRRCMPFCTSDRTINTLSDADGAHLTRTFTKSVPWLPARTTTLLCLASVSFP